MQKFWSIEGYNCGSELRFAGRRPALQEAHKLAALYPGCTYTVSCCTRNARVLVIGPKPSDEIVLTPLAGDAGRAPEGAAQDGPAAAAAAAEAATTG